PASDIYAFGCVACECATGAPPFASKGAMEVAFAHLEEEPPDPRIARPDLPPAFASAMLTALVKDPAARPASASAYADLLRAAAPPGLRAGATVRVGQSTFEVELPAPEPEAGATRMAERPAEADTGATTMRAQPVAEPDATRMRERPAPPPPPPPPPPVAEPV